MSILQRDKCRFGSNIFIETQLQQNYVLVYMMSILFNFTKTQILCRPTSNLVRVCATFSDPNDIYLTQESNKDQS